jgi:tRNA-dihydrouridine synthase A
MTDTIDRRLSVAPMLDWTDRHARYFLRLISKHTLLYTEMITTGALIHGDRKRHLQFNAEEHPVAIQLGGSEPSDMALCAKMAEDEGYDEVNINVGCPSERVQKGAFGACLMLEPALIAECVAAMRSTVSLPITVKSRIGVDHQDSYDELHHFINIIREAGCGTFIIHARKAWLKGLSPKQNREVPPLKYDVVYQIKQDFPELEIIINGGITTLDAAEKHLTQVDGVMIGREAYHNPYLLSEVDRRIFGDSSTPLSRKEVLEYFIDYVQQQLDEDVFLKHMSRHILGLFHGEAGAKAWRRYLSENACKKGAGTSVLRAAGELVLCHK